MRRTVGTLVAVAVVLAGCGGDGTAQIADTADEAAGDDVSPSVVPTDPAETDGSGTADTDADDADDADDVSDGDAGTDAEDDADEQSASPSAAPQTPADDLREQQGFETPSGNIACLAADYGSGPYLQCEMISQLEPPPDEVCDFDWSGITMTGTGSATPLCASDTMRGELGNDPPVLPYGETWVAGPFTCMSEETGLTCTNGDGGRLFLSRARWEAA